MNQVRTMRDVLADIDVITKRAMAEAKKAGYAPTQMVGGDGSDMPGAENDKKVDQSAKQPQPEVAQGLPPNAQNAAGAENPEKIEGASATDVTQPVAKPDKEPAVSADANAEPKTGASKIANDLLASIRDFQKKSAAPKTEVPKTEPVKTAAAAVVVEPVKTEPAKTAENKPVDGLELTQDVLAKIASVVLATEEGVKFAETALTKAAGAEAARETFDFLQKQAAYSQGAADAEALIVQAVQMEKQAEAEYAQGAQDAERLIGALAKKAMAGKAAVKQAQPARTAQMQKLGQEVADESAADALGAMESAPVDQEITPEDLEQALVELVQEGQISPEAAQALLEAIASEGAGGEMAEGPVEGEAPPMEEAPPAPEAEGAGEDTEGKTAQAMKNAQALIDAIQKHKAKQQK